MKRFKLRRPKRLLAYSGLLLVVLLLWIQKQPLEDWWSLRSYTPSPAIAALANQTTMTSESRHLFYVAHAVLKERQAFNSHCDRKSEKTIVLGCYTNNRIYIYKVSDSQLNGVEQVTAAHEMLHVVYARLTTAQRTKLDNLLTAQMRTITDPNIIQLEHVYSSTEPGELLNEMNSTLGTQVATLSPALNAYYRQYFTNRQVIVRYASQYEQVFVQNSNQINEISSQLNALSITIDSDQKTLKTEQADLASRSQTLNSLKASGQIDAYNNDVGPYNQEVGSFNALLSTTQQLVNQYNTLVTTRNQLAVATNQLNADLNSRFKAIPSKQEP